MTAIEKIRTSFSIRLSLWVVGFVLVILGLVISLLVSFSEEVIRDETIDTTLQALENSALRVDSTLRQSEMTARLEKQRLRVKPFANRATHRGKQLSPVATGVATQRTALCDTTGQQSAGHFHHGRRKRLPTDGTRRP
jgi:hypothetical protein